VNIHSTHPQGPRRILALAASPDFEQSLRTAFDTHRDIDLEVVRSGPESDSRNLGLGGASLILVELDAGRPDRVAALQQLAAKLAGRIPVIVVTNVFNEVVGRQLLASRIADFLIKPVTPDDLVRACARASQGTMAAKPAEAQICTFFPAAGGVGVTTLSIQAALLLMRAGSRNVSSTCLVDLDFQHGACADYLDLEPRLDLGEIEPRPERLDHQLLEVMLSHHASGLAVVAAPHRPAEMRTFDADIVTRLLDLVAAKFDHVVIDMPRTWFSWTDNVLLGSNKLFVVTETTVPGLRHARHLVDAITERLTDAVQPRVIVNRFDQGWFASGLRRADIKQALGEAFAGTIPNDYRLVREAIDRGVPLDEVKSRNPITADLKKMIMQLDAARAPKAPQAPGREDRGAAWAR
jgi:pilus assembly protein CpaE